jgi:cysteate synthase
VISVISLDESYFLSCPVCHSRFPDTYLLNCPAGCGSLLRAIYPDTTLTIRERPGLFKYSDWLPIKGFLPTRATPACYQSTALAGHLGLSDLWIGFAGYWPERGVFVTSGSFKEFEALPTIVRLRERASGVIVVASAGNTGRAFAQVSAETGQPVIIVIPDKAKDRIWTSVAADHLLLITVDGDYTDAITLANTLSSIPGIYPEGGAKNIARRDGMGTMMLEGTVAMKRMPDWYVQAVGSGTGGIAAWEASIRLKEDGRFGQVLPRLFLIQNEPFVPMVSAWKSDRREICPESDMPDSRYAISQVYSDVLTNRAPPYGIRGGVFDALTETRGIMESVSSAAARDAGVLFHRLEGIDPDPAAAVCVAGLIKGIQAGMIHHEDRIFLAITGGGYERIRKDMMVVVNRPSMQVNSIIPQEQIMRQVRTWVKKYV